MNNFHDHERRANSLIAHAKFENESGDHLTLLNVFKAYVRAERQRTWCHENYLNNSNLNYAQEVRNQLKDICKRINLEFSSCGNQFDKVELDILEHFNFFELIIFLNLINLNFKIMFFF